MYFVKLRGTDCVLRKINLMNTESKEFKDFEHNFFRINSVRHPNIVQRLGMMVQCNCLVILVEQMDKSLNDFLSSDPCLLPSDEVDMVHGICCALDYLRSGDYTWISFRD